MKKGARLILLTCVLASFGVSTARAQTTDTITELRTSAGASCFGQPVTFTVVVTSNPAGLGTPTGTVDFKDDATVIDTETLDASGQASFSTASLTAGSHSITAQYSGDSSFNTSTSSSATVTVNALPDCSISGADWVCAGSTSNLYSGPAGLTAYRWSVTGKATLSGPVNAASVSVNAGASGIFTLTLALTNASGCSSTCSRFVVILAQPTAVVSGGGAICPGNSANIQATLSGDGPWTLVWSDGFTQVDVDANPVTRSVSPASTTIYSVTSVTDLNCANSGSGSATVTVNTAPVVTANPASKAVCAGSSASFTATATASPAPTIQWQVSTDGGATFLNVANATNNTYTVATSAGDHGKQYRAQFSNVCGVVASAAATLTVNALPTCSISGADAVCASSINTLYSGPAGLTAYRWSVTGSATLSGSTTAQSVSVNAGASGAFTLTLALTNASGCSSTCGKTVIVLAQPTAVVSSGGAICTGSSTNIQAALSGAGPWTLVWSDGFTQANVAASPATRSVSPASTTVYSVTTVTDANCSNSGSGSATVTVNTAPVVTANLANKAVCAGSSVSFAASASGSPTPTAQWQVSTDGGVTFANVAGATNATYTFTASLTDSDKRFRVLFTNPCGSALSIAASLVVNALPSAVITTAPIICANSTGNIASVPSAGAGASYAWTVSGGTITSGAGTSSITYTAGSSSVNISVSVTTAQGCSASSSQSVAFASQGKNFEGWRSKTPLQWQGSTFNDGDHQYSEGNTLPMRLELTQMCPGPPGASSCAMISKMAIPPGISMTSSAPTTLPSPRSTARPATTSTAPNLPPPPDPHRYLAELPAARQLYGIQRRHYQRQRLHHVSRST